MTREKFHGILVPFMTLAGITALTIQFFMIVASAEAHGATAFEGVVKYFSYFTILTNLAITIGLGSRWLAPQSRVGKYFSGASVLSGLLPAIMMVGIVYEVMLRRYFNPQGIQFGTDLVLHDLIPPLYFLFWALYVPKDQFRWKDPWVWLIYPLIYLFFILTRGAVAHVYPYPFMDVLKRGYPKVLLSSVELIFAFEVVSHALVAFGRSVPLVKRDGSQDLTNC